MRGDDDMIKLCYQYAHNAQQWRLFMENYDAIKQHYEQYVCNYSESMELVTDNSGREKLTSFPLVSLYTDYDNYLRIGDWVWARKGGFEKYSFDSEAEKEWAEILKEISHEVAKRFSIEERDPELFEEDGKREHLYAWGKNYPYGSEIKFEYYLHGTHTSYPDFVLKDKNNRIHLFEVKSLNVKAGLNINSDDYKDKVRALKECYKHCSILTGQLFYLPVLEGEKWKITRFVNGEEKTLTEREFRNTILR